MKIEDKTRRVIILCQSFARNFAYYRSGHDVDARKLLDPSRPDSQFWLEVNGNFIDKCVLEWCKIFDDKKGHQHWTKVVKNCDEFEAGLLCAVGVNSDEFKVFAGEMRQYRDKFVAHLDNLPTMCIPKLDVAIASVRHLHNYLAAHEAGLATLAGLTTNQDDFDKGLDQCICGAKQVYDRAIS